MSGFATLRVGTTALLAVFVLHTPGYAQDAASATVRVTRSAIVLEQPRGDSIRVASVAPGVVLDVFSTRDRWYLVGPSPAGTAKHVWERGWIHSSFVEVVSGTLPEALQLAGTPRQAPSGRLQIRGFAQTGGVLFAARDSFDTILGSPFGPVIGGGAQVVFPNHTFVQVSAERFRETGTRALVSGTHIFTVDTPATLTVLPILGTVGYRPSTSRRFAPYLGAGVGWHVLTEDSPGTATPRTRKGKIGYHLMGGSELTLTRVFALAGEVQWTTVPNGIGSTGISAVFGEDDLGGTTFRFKVIVGY